MRRENKETRDKNQETRSERLEPRCKSREEVLTNITNFLNRCQCEYLTHIIFTFTICLIVGQFALLERQKPTNSHSPSLGSCILRLVSYNFLNLKKIPKGRFFLNLSTKYSSPCSAFSTSAKLE